MVLLKKYWLSLLVLSIIFILCFMDTGQLPAAPVANFDKLVHSLMFLGLSGVIFFDGAGYLRYPVSVKWLFVVTFLFPVAIGGLIEIMQANLTTYRSGDWFDFLFDGFGAAVGFGIAFLINRWIAKRAENNNNNP